MHHIIIDKYSEINLILERFFHENYTRSSLPKKSEDEDLECFDFACRIYKRGFILSSSSALSSSAPCLSSLSSRGEPFGETAGSTQIGMDPAIKSRDDILNSRDDLLNSHNNIFNSQNDTFYIIDENFLKHHPHIQNIITCKNYFIYCPSESTKNLSTVINIIKKIPEDTKSLFAMGGGITLDISGFIAGLLNIPIDYISTTLLASIDAAVGGKTGVNFSPYGKNQVGLFYNARSISFKSEFMHTLTQQEKVCGVVEAIKQAYLFGEVEKDILILEKIIENKVSPKELSDIVQKNYHYKSFVVELDPQEKKDIRSSLNFGHTLAHVLEALCEEKYIEYIPHGIAVAHGLKFLMDSKFIEIHNEFNLFINKILQNYPIKISKNFSVEIIISILSQDKKNSQPNICALSLPRYGIFSFNDKINLESESNSYKITQEFSTEEISKIMLDYCYFCK